MDNSLGDQFIGNIFKNDGAYHLTMEQLHHKTHFGDPCIYRYICNFVAKPIRPGHPPGSHGGSTGIRGGGAIIKTEVKAEA